MAADILELMVIHCLAESRSQERDISGGSDRSCHPAAVLWFSSAD